MAKSVGHTVGNTYSFVGQLIARTYSRLEDSWCVNVGSHVESTPCDTITLSYMFVSELYFNHLPYDRVYRHVCILIGIVHGNMQALFWRKTPCHFVLEKCLQIFIGIFNIIIYTATVCFKTVRYHGVSDTENESSLHFAINIFKWVIFLHGKLWGCGNILEKHAFVPTIEVLYPIFYLSISFLSFFDIVISGFFPFFFNIISNSFPCCFQQTLNRCDGGF